MARSWLLQISNTLTSRPRVVGIFCQRPDCRGGGCVSVCGAADAGEAPLKRNDEGRREKSDGGTSAAGEPTLFTVIGIGNSRENNENSVIHRLRFSMSWPFPNPMKPSLPCLGRIRAANLLRRVWAVPGSGEEAPPASFGPGRVREGATQRQGQHRGLFPAVWQPG